MRSTWIGLMALCTSLGCDPAKELARAKEERADAVREVELERARLANAQAVEARALAARDEPRASPANEDLAQKHEREAAALEARAHDKMASANAAVHEASVEVEDERRAIAESSRARLSKMAARYRELSVRAPAKVEPVREELDGFEDAWQATERDVEALDQVAAANVKRARTDLEHELGALEKRLDRVAMKID